MGVLLKTQLNRRIARVRSKISGTSGAPRLAVRRTNTRVIAQLIDDSKAVTLAYASDFDLPKADHKKTKSERALLVGQVLAKKALERNIKTVVFDRHGYLFHGRVAKVAEGARSGGLTI